MTHLAFVDIESRSAVDLAAKGFDQYVRDPSTVPVSVVALADNACFVWVNSSLYAGQTGMPLGEIDVPERYGRAGDVRLDFTPEPPTWLYRLARTRTFVGHNAAGFDEPYMRRVLNINATWLDTLPLARQAGLPGQLDAIGERLLGVGKHAGSKILPRFYDASKAAPFHLLWALVSYNICDCLITRRLYREVEEFAADAEHDVIALHHKINARGVGLDRDLRGWLTELSITAKERAGEEIERLTSGRLKRTDLRSVPKMKAWLGENGFVVDNMRRETINKLLGDPDAYFTGDAELGITLQNVMPVVPRVLRLRSAATRNTEAKLDKMDNRADQDDHRLRGLLVYYGAHTGRFSSRIVQLHNMHRGVPKCDVQGVIRQLADAAARYTDKNEDAERKAAHYDIVTAEADRLRTQHGMAWVAVDDVIGTLLRYVLVPTPGRLLGIVDYAAIEARGAAWIAGEDKLLDIYRANGDPYCDFGSTLFGRPITKKDEKERFVAKTIILGCIAEGTPILTSNGWKPIERVTTEDRLWDGVEWVSHDGLIDRGTRDCIEVDGVWLTPDHEVLTRNGWMQACKLETRSGCGSSWRWSLDGTGAAIVGSPVGVRAESPATFNATTYKAGSRSSAVAVPTPSGTRNVDIATTSKHQQRHDCSTDYPRSYRGVEILRAAGTPRTAVAGSMFTNRGYSTVGCSSTMLGHSKGGTIRHWNSTGSTTTPDINRGTYVSCLAPRRCVTHGAIAGFSTRAERTPLPISTGSFCRSTQRPDQSTGCSEKAATLPVSSGNPTQKRRVYDLLNAGPRFRFQAGPLIVHNCQYGLGAEKLAMYAANAGIDFHAVNVTAEQCIQTYRQTYGRIQAVWYELADAVRLAVDNPGEVYEAGRCAFGMCGPHLICQLPSGRELCYRNTRVEDVLMRWGETRPGVTYDHHHGYRKQFWHGLICENAVQAICRDLLCGAMLRLDRIGLDIVLHVHDEIVAELDDMAQLHVMEREMRRGETWSDGFPIEVEGHVSTRYGKIALV